MRTIVPIFLLLASSSLAAYAAEPVENPKGEIIYRSNLGRADDVKLLIKQGVSPDEKNAAGIPLLALGAMRTDAEGLNIVKALIEAGANVDNKDSNGQTALFYAARVGNMDVVQYLLVHHADYYLRDSKGNVARNVAYENGHKDITEAMDQFVIGQTAQVHDQYKKFNEDMEQRYKQMATPAPGSHEVIPAPTTTAPAEHTAPPTAEDIAIDAARLAAQQSQHEHDAAAIASLGQELSLANCAFQYWSYCRAAGQSTELSTEELITSVESHKDTIKALEDQLINQYKQPSSFVTQISDSAKKRIFNELNIMPSKSYRHENGVGKASDMESRCALISREWNAPPPARLAAPPVRSKSNNRSGGDNEYAPKSKRM